MEKIPLVKYPLVSIIITCYKQHDNLIRMVEAMEKQTFQDFEIIICDNGGEDWDLIKNKLAEFSHMTRYVWQQRHGFWNSKNINNGVRMADGKWIWVLNGDMIPHDNQVLEKYVSLANEKKVLFGCRCMDSWKEGQEIEYNQAGGNNYFFSKAKFIEVGMFDERHHSFGGDDYALSLRFQKLGDCKLYAHKSCCCDHIDHPTTKTDAHTFEVLQETEERFGLR